MPILRKTEYFLSDTFINGYSVTSVPDSPQKALDQVITKRDVFLKNNLDTIDEIINETIRFDTASYGGYNTYSTFAVLTLTYYPKEYKK